MRHFNRQGRQGAPHSSVLQIKNAVAPGDGEVPLQSAVQQNGHCARAGGIVPGVRPHAIVRIVPIARERKSRTAVGRANPADDLVRRNPYFIRERWTVSPEVISAAHRRRRGGPPGSLMAPQRLRTLHRHQSLYGGFCHQKSLWSFTISSSSSGNGPRIATWRRPAANTW